MWISLHQRIFVRFLFQRQNSFFLRHEFKIYRSFFCICLLTCLYQADNISRLWVRFCHMTAHFISNTIEHLRSNVKVRTIFRSSNKLVFFHPILTQHIEQISLVFVLTFRGWLRCVFFLKQMKEKIKTMKRNGIDRHNNMIHRPKISLFFLLCIRWHAIKLLFGPRSFNNTLSPYRTILNIYRTHQMIQFFTLHNEFFMKMDFFVRVLVFWTHFVGDVSLCEPILFYSKGAGLFEQRSINIGILGIVFRTKLVIIERGTMKIVILTQILHFRLGPSFDSVHLLWIISPSDGNSAIISAIMRFEVLISLDFHSFYSNRLCWDWHNIPNWRHLHI